MKWTRTGKRGGFTLIEVMVLLAILAMLAVIYVPQINAYRARRYDSMALQDAKGAAKAQDAYFSDHATYAGSVKALEESRHGLSHNPGVKMNIEAGTGAYKIQTSHSLGSVTYTIRGPREPLPN